MQFIRPRRDPHFLAAATLCKVVATIDVHRAAIKTDDPRALELIAAVRQQCMDALRLVSAIN